jgi:hypothetical protein
MKIEINATFRRMHENSGDIEVEVAGVQVLTIETDRIPGAEPNAEENLITETIQELLLRYLPQHGFRIDSDDSRPCSAKRVGIRLTKLLLMSG